MMVSSRKKTEMFENGGGRDAARLPRTLQTLVPDTCMAQLPWGSCTTALSSPQIPFIAYANLSQFLFVTTKRTSVFPFYR